MDSPFGSVRYRNISLTAHVLITLAELKDLRGVSKSIISHFKHYFKCSLKFK